LNIASFIKIHITNFYFNNFKFQFINLTFIFYLLLNIINFFKLQIFNLNLMFKLINFLFIYDLQLNIINFFKINIFIFYFYKLMFKYID